MAKRPTQLSRMSDSDYKELMERHPAQKAYNRSAGCVGRLSPQEYKDLMGERSGLYGCWMKSVLRKAGGRHGTK